MPTDSLNRQNFLAAESPLESNNILLFPNLPSPFDLASKQAIPRFGASSNSSLLNPPNGFESQSGFTSGYFTVGSTGQVGIDYLFDGGGYQSELGIFSLEGLQQFEAGSNAFIQEVVRRVLSQSTLGNVVVSDASEGARFSASLEWEGNLNSGEYLGVKTVAMNPGDRFGVVTLPNGTFQQAFATSNFDGSQRPLFSLGTANPNSAFQFGQIADVTGTGSTFVMEDLRLDTGSDKDYNDIIFQVLGAVGSAVSLEQVINPAYDWRPTDLGQKIIAQAGFYVAPGKALPGAATHLVEKKINYAT